ncbi:MAG: PaaI family thioesterase [Ectothiorhodospiraceae bacterium]|nr:PaaI family thioesterase [Ectothiorhodospiraceae bacterium]
MPKLSAVELEELITQGFPDLRDDAWRIEDVRDHYVRVRMPFHRSNLRPGGTISGPALMELADVAMYAAVLAMLGPVVMAVTTSLNINFMRKPEPGDIIGECRLLKLGNRLAVGEVTMHADGDDALVAHAAVTYSIPPKEQRPA